MWIEKEKEELVPWDQWKKQTNKQKPLCELKGYFYTFETTYGKAKVRCFLSNQNDCLEWFWN